MSKKRIIVIILVIALISMFFLIGFVTYQYTCKSENEKYNSLNNKYTELKNKESNGIEEGDFTVTDEKGKVVKQVNGLEEQIKRKENKKNNEKKAKSKKEIQIEVNKIQDMINKKQYQKFYDTFNKEYAKNMNYTAENISRKYNFNGPITIEVKNYNVNNSSNKSNRVISVEFKNDKSNFFTYLTFFEDGTIADSNIQYETQPVGFKPITIDNVTYKYIKYYSGTDDSIYIIDINNESEYGIKLLKVKAKKDSIDLGATLGLKSVKEYYPSETGLIQITVPQSKQISNIILEVENSCGEKKEINITR